MAERFIDFVHAAEALLDQLRGVLSSLRQNVIKPTEAIRRFEGDVARQLYQHQHTAEYNRSSFVAGMHDRLPAGYNHLTNCALGADLFVLESAFHLVVANIFLVVAADPSDPEYNEPAKSLQKARGNFDRALDFMDELRWYRRWRSAFSSRRRKRSVEDIKNSAHATRDAIHVTEQLIGLRDVKRVNQLIEINNEVVNTLVSQVHESPEGMLPDATEDQYLACRHHLLQLQIEMVQYPSSWAVLRARESLHVSAAVLHWGWFGLLRAREARDELTEFNQIMLAQRALEMAYKTRKRRFALLRCAPLKLIARTLSWEPAPEWARVLPKGRRLRLMRAKVAGQLARANGRFDRGGL